MKSITVLGILLAVLGIFALVYQGFSYTRQEKVLDVGPIHATRDDTRARPASADRRRIGFIGRSCIARHRRETKGVTQPADVV